MFEIIMTLFSTFFTVKDRPYLTFLIRTLALSFFMALVLTLSKVWGNTLDEYLESLNWLIGISLSIGVFLSLFQELITCGRKE